MRILRHIEVDKESRTDGRTIQRFVSENLTPSPESWLILTSQIPAGCIEQAHYHSDSMEVFYYLTPGSIEVGGTSYKLNTGDLVILEKEDVHRINAAEDMKLLVIKIPDVPDKVLVDK